MLYLRTSLTCSRVYLRPQTLPFASPRLLPSRKVQLSPFSSYSHHAFNQRKFRQSRNTAFLSMAMSQQQQESQPSQAGRPQDVMVIREVTPSIVTCSAPFSRAGFLEIGGRGTIVRLETGSLAVFSPVSLTEDVKDTVSALGGTVKYLIALDIEHHIFLDQWKSAYPEAQIVGPHGLKEKREKSEATRGLEIAHVITPENRDSFSVSSEFDAEFDMEYVYMHPNREIVVLHKPSHTLIQADLIFNLPATEQYSKAGGAGRLSSALGASMEASGSATWQKRFIWYVASSKDRDGFRKAVSAIDQWDFDRIIPCHGDVIESGGKDVFRKLFDAFLS